MSMSYYYYEDYELSIIYWSRKAQFCTNGSHTYTLIDVMLIFSTRLLKHNKLNTIRNEADKQNLLSR